MPDTLEYWWIRLSDMDADQLLLATVDRSRADSKGSVCFGPVSVPGSECTYDLEEVVLVKRIPLPKIARTKP